MISLDIHELIKDESKSWFINECLEIIKCYVEQMDNRGKNGNRKSSN